MVLIPKLLGQESLFLLGITYLSSSFKTSFIDFPLPKDPDFMRLLISLGVSNLFGNNASLFLPFCGNGFCVSATPFEK